MSSDKKVANAISGKTARACDSCLRKRARWYCAADDAFLCQGCDSSVHSANSLARRHERVRLKTASFKPSEDLSVVPYLPAWHQGFTRKARTPRHAKPTLLHRPKTEEEPLPNPLPLVPDLGNDETSLDENEEQLLYRVPILDPWVADYCTSTTSNEVAATTNDAATAVAAGSESKVVLPDYGTGDGNNLPGFLSSDMDLAEFAADVESLLGRGLDDDSFGMEGLGLLDSKDEDIKNISFETGRVKVEEGEEEVGDAEAVVACHLDPELDTARETLEFNFDYESPTTAEEEEEEKVVAGSAMMLMNSGLKTEEDTMTGSISLRLDYKAVITAWASQGSPWTTGDRPQLNPDDCWPEFLGMYPIDVHHVYEDMGGEGGQMAMGDGGREARVSRYREKRRTRLFSKKIRYEVRKLNAEKRPRMKGRFVKRSSFAGPDFPF